MSKRHLYREFIKLRATGYTYDEICTQLKITKPTAIAWGKKFASEIDESQNYYLVNQCREDILKNEDTFFAYREQFRRMAESSAYNLESKKFMTRVIKRLNTIFAAKIATIGLIFGENKIREMTFTFTRGKQVAKAKNMEFKIGDMEPPDDTIAKLKTIKKNIAALKWEKRRKKRGK